MDDATARIGMMATEAIDLLIEAVDETPLESWDQPSNLEGWSLRDLVGHATGSAAKIVTLVEDGEVWAGPSQPADWVCEDPAARLRGLAARLQDALPGANLNAMRASPEGEVPLHRALTYPVSDLALHSWDVHCSQGRLIELPRDLLALCRGLWIGAGGHAATTRRLRAGPIRASGLDADCPAHGLSRALSRQPGTTVADRISVCMASAPTPCVQAALQLLRLILSAVVIIGICSGSRARATMRIGHGLPHHNRHMLMFAGKTPRNSRAAANAANRRVRRGNSSAPVVISANPDA